MRTAGNLVGMAALIGMITPLACAHWRMPQQMPVDRVIANLEAWVKDHPTDAQSWFSLARARSYAFATASGQIQIHGDANRLEVTLGIGRLRVEKDPSKDLAAAVNHLDAGIRAFNTAIKLKPGDAAMRYGLACLVEDGVKVSVKARAFPMLDTQVIDSQDSRLYGDGKDFSKPESLDALKQFFLSEDRNSWGRSIDSLRAAEWMLVRARFKQESSEIERMWSAAWNIEMCDLYFTAACFALPEESTAREQSLTGLSSFISYQAARDYLRVCTLPGSKEDFPVRKAIASSVVESMESLPPCRAITPLVVPLDDSVCLSQVIDRNAAVGFDLDGTGRLQTSQWITPQAAFLVWDPGHTGRITSGRQFFGSATWWLFFEDGFRALASLDDDQNGMIQGDELAGLALWRDGNGDGRSDPGEVAPVQQWGVRSLACRVDDRELDGLVSRSGVVIEVAGQSLTRPLWNWITTPRVESMTEHRVKTSQERAMP